MSFSIISTTGEWQQKCPNLWFGYCPWPCGETSSLISSATTLKIKIAIWGGRSLNVVRCLTYSEYIMRVVIWTWVRLASSKMVCVSEMTLVRSALEHGSLINTLYLDTHMWINMHLALILMIFDNVGYFIRWWCTSYFHTSRPWQLCMCSTI